MKPRIRTVKPEALTDEVLWDLETSTGMPLYRAYQGLWMCADREGRFEWRPRALKLHCLPYWEGDFDAALEALASKLFIVRYTVDGKDYGYVRTLAKHQRFDHREPPSILPAPDDHARACPGEAEQPPPVCPGPARVEGKGTEGNGRERKGECVEGAPDGTPSAPPVRVVFDEWQRVHNHPTAQLDAKRVRRIRAALKLHTPEQLQQAIRGALKDDWLMGRDPKSPRKYDGLETLLRDTAQIERLIELERKGHERPRRFGSAQPNLGRTGFESVEDQRES